MFSYRCHRIIRFRGAGRYFGTMKKSVKTGSPSTEENNDLESGHSKNNELGIPMISADLHRRLFGEKNRAKDNDIDKGVLQRIRSRISKAARVNVEHLRKGATSSSAVFDDDLDIPALKCETIEGHFTAIAEEQIADYRKLADKLATMILPPMPELKAWVIEPGWTKYSSDGTVRRVDFPEEDALFFDVEVCQQGIKPTLAVAVSENAWYAWCSAELCNKKNETTSILQYFLGDGLLLNDLIPLESKAGENGVTDRRKRLVIGHNVAYDRTYVKEQYYLQKTDLRFFDTMSMHIAVGGYANVQRAVHMKNKGKRNEITASSINDANNKSVLEKNEWEERGSMNSLVDVYHHYCPEGKINLDKQVRDDLFLHGSLEDVRDDVHEAIHYCAQDVAATFEVFSKLLPQFWARFPHPVTFAGMLEMGTTYLPINDSWKHFVEAAEESYNAELKKIDRLLLERANASVNLLKDEKYKDDPWLWDEDWSTVVATKFYKVSAARNMKRTSKETPEDHVEKVWNNFEKSVREATTYLPKLPKWYKALSKRHDSNDYLYQTKNGSENGANWGPQITLLMRIAPKLLRMHFHGYPLHYHLKHGWGYLVPSDCEDDSSPNDPNPQEDSDDPHPQEDSEGRYCIIGPKNRTLVFPLRRLKEVVFQNRNGAANKGPDHDHDCGLPGVKFYKLPHKDGAGFNVGSPLAKHYIDLIEDGTLQSHHESDAKLVAAVNRKCSYWRITRDRISISEKTDVAYYGAILPRVIMAGTVTRRAVEPLWMTASNAKKDRIGSEVKGLIQAPPGYVFVGADVDSQELWIAALLGDSWKHKIHGCTPFSWMLLRGNKADGTDQHSMVAAELGVSRDHAKVLNYGRIYGAGLPFAVVLLKQFRQGVDALEIQDLAKRLYGKTKGRRENYCLLTEDGTKEFLRGCGEDYSAKEPLTLGIKEARKRFSELNLQLDDYCAKTWQQWAGGTESEVFNRLEHIALSDEASTPVLGCRLSKALELGSENKDFLPSRINWVVQSSAVDYLHLMLVCMRWLFDTYQIDGRFSISIHDEVRYLVSEKDKYRAALALQLTNLLTRAMFVSKMGMTGLPESVAYFNKVDIDKALRKEVDLDCVTPSNPLGLSACYQIPRGEALDMNQIMAKTHGGRLDPVG